MKINPLDAHDRLAHLKQDQSDIIAQGASDCLLKNSLSLALQEKSDYIYIFAHPRTDEDGVTKRMLWQPRLSKPKAQTNSYLFRAQSKTDTMEIIWLLPPREMWKQYTKGMVTEDDLTLYSINMFKDKREDLEKADIKDYPEDVSRRILRQVIDEHRQAIKSTRMMDKLWFPTLKI
jgi:hypothetical protein